MSPVTVVEAIPAVGPLLAALGPVGLLLAIGLALLALVLARRALSRPSTRPDQVAAVSRQEVVWRPKRVLNGGEAAIYASACNITTRIDPAWRVWPQVSLGEVLRTEGHSDADREAFRWINSKRADFLVVDGEGWPVAVIEYQGSGHYQGNASERDAVKRTVLPRAGIHYIEVAAPLSRRRSQLDALLDEELRAARP
ncbi:Hypothetical protein HVIM_04493 (plasmid) [Roseomonas mucosa]|uniref:DUF2726 domain-containing protein n=1 Tax=Roseomonas mucosa TaxID=207340 RepID=UPI0024C64492|nr:DUF2726 domain-containing protein [Roseomonas mucosa]QDD92659.1 Hypothetical protein HVIM_04493 [Roseomonas mucosa]